MRDLNEIQCFVKAVETKTLTGAAKALDLPKSSVSRKLRSLETRLGLTLLTRTTRAIHLTDAGKQFFERASLALKAIDTAEESLDGTKNEVEGLLRITVPVEFSFGPFNDFTSAFLLKYPKVRLELLITERPVDLIAEGFDLAFRIGTLKDSTLIARRVAVFEAQIMASPAYIKQYGEPKNLGDLEKHRLIGFSPVGHVEPWNLKSDSGKKTIMPVWSYAANHLPSLKEAAVNGVGLSLLPHYVAQNELSSKKLKIVCRDWSSSAYPISLIFPGQKFLSARMRAFIDFANKELKL